MAEALNLYEEEELGICGRAWPAADVLAEYFEWRFTKYPIPESSETFRFLELGSGTGITSLLLAKSLTKCMASGSFQIVATDLAIAVPLIDKNIQANCLSDRLKAQRLEWGTDADTDLILRDGPLDMIFASDVTYYPELFAPLISSLHRLARSMDGKGELIVCNRIRELQKELPFYGKLGKYFSIVPIDDWEKFWTTYKEAGFLLLRLELRPTPLETDHSDEFACLMLNWISDF